MKKTQLLKKPLEALTDTDIECLLGIDKNSRVAEVVAEYVRRKAQRSTGGVIIKDSKSVAQVLRPYFFGLEVENFMVVTMNRKNEILNVHNVSKGGISSTIADPKVIFDKALRDKASAIILAHNHPSGHIVPSDSDDGLMRKIKGGGELLDISVLDSIIIGKDESYYSYADEGRF